MTETKSATARAKSTYGVLLRIGFNCALRYPFFPVGPIRPEDFSERAVRELDHPPVLQFTVRH